MGREFELKYRADDRTIENIQKKFGDFTPISMETSYYDTPGSDFARRRWTLRRRWENGVGVCTLKTPAADGSRCEWEVPCDDIRSGIEKDSVLALSRPARDIRIPNPDCGRRSDHNKWLCT